MNYGEGDEAVRLTAPGTSDTITLMESKIRMHLTTTKFLKGALKQLHVSGLANAPFFRKGICRCSKMLTISYNL